MKRLGRLYISDELMSENIGELYEVFSQLRFIPVRVEHMWHRSVFEMCGISPLFDEIKIGDESPTYKIIINRSGIDIEVSVERERN